MASELLKTFRKIDDSRKVMIERARLLGHNVDDKASFIELAGTITPAPEITGTVPQATWDRPKEWPDAKAMIREGEERDGMVPGAYIMIKSDADTFTIPNVIASMSNSSSVRMIGADGYLMSDGTWYNSATENITHTWDKSKDIIIEDGEYAGTYRWLLCYYNPANSVKGYDFLLQYMGVVELIIGYIPKNNNNTTTITTASILVAQGDSGYADLVNFEVLPESNLRGSTWSYGMSWTFARSLNNVRNLDFGPMSGAGVNSGTNYFNATNKLVNFYAPNLVNLQSNSSAPSNCIVLSSSSDLQNVVYGGTRPLSIQRPLYNLKKLHAPRSVVILGSTSLATQFAPYFRNDIDLNIGYLAANSIPHNWTSTTGTKLTMNVGAINNVTETTSNTSIAIGHPNLVTLDLTDAILYNYTKVSSNSDSYNYPGEACPKLRNIIIPAGFANRLNLKYVDLTHSSLVDILDNLKDLTNDTVYYPNIKLGKQNLDKLTEDEIKIATDKGWSVIE